MLNNLVTICITTYNRKILLPLTLKSILNQTYKNIEVLIIDDCSNDGTRELIENELLKLDDRIKCIRHTENKGLANGRNTAINNAKGKYFTFCDDDDEWKENFIEEFVKIADIYPSDWCFYCGIIYKNFLGRIVNVISEYEGTLKQHIRDGFTPPVASQFYALESLKKVNGYNEKIKSGVDHDLWIRLAKININVKSIPTALSIPNANAKHDRMTTNYKKRIKGIKNSLLIWKADLEWLYGESFYFHFCNAYMKREKMKFLYFYMSELEIRKAYGIKGDMSNLFFGTIIIKTMIKFVIKFFMPKDIINDEKNVKSTAVLKVIK